MTDPNSIDEGVLQGPASPREIEPPTDGFPATSGTYCPRCGTVVPVEQRSCANCKQEIDHDPSQVQRLGLLAGMGFIILGGIFVFVQPRAYHTFAQDVVEVAIILCVAGAVISFFTAVIDMIRRGGE